jgi:hypothetical protein
MKTAFLSALTIILFATANAQTVSANTSQTITLTLENQIDISLVSGTDNGTTFAFNTTNDYASGLTNSDASQFRVRSNRSWNVTVAAASANFTSSSATTMPANKLGVRLKGVTPFTQLATTGAELTSGSKGGSNTFIVDYNANPGFDYDAGTYTLSVVYTATQQ